MASEMLEAYNAPRQNFQDGILSPDLRGIQGLVPTYSGKVRDVYQADGVRVMVTTDRQSAFDRILGTIPMRGAVLNKLSEWWFRQTEDIVPNHMIAVPHPNVLISREAPLTLPVEIVVRDYLAKSSTPTSLYGMYQNNPEQNAYGIQMRPGYRPNEKLDETVVTPTTKSKEHDEPLTDEAAREIVDSQLGDGMWDQAKETALKLFAFGRETLAKKGIILVDTKYEFGIIDGKLTLIDEVHTPDSSRYWLAESYQERFEAGRPPENYDKEVLRAALAEQGFKGEGPVPIIAQEIKQAMTDRYTEIYTLITGDNLEPTDEAGIVHAVSTYLAA